MSAVKRQRTPSARLLTGHYRPEHVFALRQALELYDSYQAKVAECDHAIEAVLASFEQADPKTALPAARHKTRQANEPTFDVRAALFQLLGHRSDPAAWLWGLYRVDARRGVWHGHDEMAHRQTFHFVAHVSARE